MAEDFAGVSTINPATAERLDFYPYTTPDDLDEVLDRAQDTAQTWRRTTVDEKRAALDRFASTLRSNRETFATLITREMGKPFAQALAEIDKCIFTAQYYNAQLLELLSEETIDLGSDVGRVRLAPLGVVFAILPWNYPWWQVVRAMLPAILVGNTVVLKHADSVTGSAFAIEEAVTDSFGLPLLQTVVADPQTTSSLIADSRISAVTFTGSDRVGSLVAAAAGASLKKCVLELGGSDPFIVLSDADVDAAARAAVKSRFLNNGQSCIAAKRVFVHASIKEAFYDALTPFVTQLVVGDPMESTTDVGPLARMDLLATLEQQRDAATAEGSQVVASAAVPSGPGAWFSPTFMQVDRADSTLLTDETFGPLGALTTAATEEDLIALANKSRFGLSSSIWSRDIERAEEVSRALNVGSVFINQISATDPRLPTGGVKASGYGRELGRWGLVEFANVQSVRIGKSQ